MIEISGNDLPSNKDYVREGEDAYDIFRETVRQLEKGETATLYAVESDGSLVLIECETRND